MRRKTIFVVPGWARRAINSVFMVLPSSKSEMLERWFSQGIHVETKVETSLMIEEVPAVEQECRLLHAFVDAAVVQFPVEIPLGQDGDGVASADASLGRRCTGRSREHRSGPAVRF
jgi:hypothetical protein